MPINSREKGKRFELTVAHLFKDHGYNAYRTAQHCGNTGDAPDVDGVPYLHIEAKNQQKMHLYDWMEQAVRDSKKKGNVPVVIHKANNKEVLVTMRWCDFIEFYSEWEAGHEVQN